MNGEDRFCALKERVGLERIFQQERYHPALPIITMNDIRLPQ